MSYNPTLCEALAVLAVTKLTDPEDVQTINAAIQAIIKTPETEVHKSCTCHPDDNPPVPCPRKYALSECRAAAECWTDMIGAAPVYGSDGHKPDSPEPTP